MKFVEISASLGNGLKRYNVFTQVSMEKQPFSTRWVRVLYGVTKPTDIVQTNTPTNILVDIDGNPIGTSEPVYFGIRVYPFISLWYQNISCNNNNFSYGDNFELDPDYYFLGTSERSNNVIVPDHYDGKLYPQPEFVPSLPDGDTYTTNHYQAMQQFVNDCVFPTRPNLDLPGQSLSSTQQGNNGIPYFNPNVVVLSELNRREPRGVLSFIQDEETSSSVEFENYMVQFGGQNLNFKFGMATNSDFSEPPNIYLPYLYRTYCGLAHYYNNGEVMGVIMQCLLYDSNGKVISA